MLLRLLALAVLLSTLAGCQGPLQIAVVGIIDPEGESSNNPGLPLRWALENIQAAGGPELELVENELPASIENNDAGRSRVIEVGRVLSEHPYVVGALGFNYSWRLEAVAPLFVQQQKVVISPTSTAGGIYRKFKGTDYVWRVTESDIAQTQMMLVAGVQQHRKQPLQTVALLTSYDAYGTTFFDTFAFFAAELGLTVTDVRRYDQSDENPDRCVEPLSGMLDDNEPPQLLYLAASSDPHIDCVVTELARRRDQGLPGASTDLFLTDTGVPNELMERHGSNAVGLEGTKLSFDQASGFDDAFAARHPGERFHSEMGNYYDALLLLAYGLAQAEASGASTRDDYREALVQGLKDTVDGRGTAVGWQADGVAEAFARIRSGEDPDVSGATGPLLYDNTDNAYTDLLFSTYAHWRIGDEGLEQAGYFPTFAPNSDGEFKDSSLFEATAQRQAEVDDGSWEPPVDHGRTRALIVAGSSGTENYRHQADALAQYDLLRANGLSADDITLVLAGDLSGPLRNRPDGPDLAGRQDEVDAFLDDVDAADLLAMLEALAEGPADNIYVFLVGHGGRDGFYVGGTVAADNAGDSDAGSGGLLTGQALLETVASLRDDDRFRRMLIAVEACFGGVLGRSFAEAEEPVNGVLVLTGASPFENSLAANYDADTGLWLADEFAFRLHDALADPALGDLALDDLYVDWLYPHVRGSHVSIYNASSFGSLADVTAREFVNPP